MRKFDIERGPMRVLGVLALSLAIATTIVFANSGHLIVVDQPVRADVILVPHGDSNDIRFWRAISFLRTGYGRAVLLDTADNYPLFGTTETALARQFVARLQLNHVHVCPGAMNSMIEEGRAVQDCLAGFHPQRILVVTSEFETRLALTVFQHRLPEYRWSVAAAPDPSLYDVHWWRSRESAKTWIFEIGKFAWWELVDRWH